MPRAVRTAFADQGVQVRVHGEVSAPGVQSKAEACFCTEVLRVPGDAFEHGCRTGKQYAGKPTGVLQPQSVKRVRDREHGLPVCAGQQVLLVVFEPVVAVGAAALRAAAVAARVVINMTVMPRLATRALFDATTKRGGTAVTNMPTRVALPRGQRTRGHQRRQCLFQYSLDAIHPHTPQPDSRSIV